MLREQVKTHRCEEVAIFCALGQRISESDTVPEDIHVFLAIDAIPTKQSDRTSSSMHRPIVFIHEHEHVQPLCRLQYLELPSCILQHIDAV